MDFDCFACAQRVSCTIPHSSTNLLVFRIGEKAVLVHVEGSNGRSLCSLFLGGHAATLLAELVGSTCQGLAKGYFRIDSIELAEGRRVDVLSGRLIWRQNANESYQTFGLHVHDLVQDAEDGCPMDGIPEIESLHLEEREQLIVLLEDL